MSEDPQRHEPPSDGPWDDETLLAELGRALREEPPPAALVAEAKSVYTWRTIDAELAALSYDSATERGEATAWRSETTATLRTLSFEARALSLELAITDDAVLGQVVPPQPGRIEVRTPAAVLLTAAVDEVGCFVIRPAPTGRFRLHCTTADGHRVLTSWIIL